ncbi:MAG: hypothetical protein HXY49_10810 [Ignavibacteriaceae bacterium]|nr:hypothetical protein [Ignavibacteriaceae bacterium]
MSIQTLLSMGALIILSLASLRFNSVFLETSTTEVENKVYMTAFSLADDLIEEIKQKAFDANTINFPTNNPAGLTPAGSLGPGWWEIYPNYNDIDDYNYFKKTVSAPHAENYTVYSRVYYVTATNPNQISTTQTFYKKVVVTVSSKYFRKPVSLNFIFTLK